LAPVDHEGPKILIGIFMSPFDVHHNRAPLSGTVEWIRHHPPQGRNLHMSLMHWRTVLRIPPFFAGSLHLIRNERTVTKFRGAFKGHPVSCYTIQIAGGSVRGIETRVKAGDSIEGGEVFGMIRIGSQVDLVVPSLDCMTVRVKAGDKARAGETILID
jgi:phosphatidylserine decarboxylase